MIYQVNDEFGTRIDAYLAKKDSSKSRGYFQTAIEQEKVLVNR